MIINTHININTIQIIIKFHNKTNIIEINDGDDYKKIILKIVDKMNMKKNPKGLNFDDNYFIINNNRLLTKYNFNKLKILNKLENNSIFYIEKKIKGGIFDMLADLLDGLLTLLTNLGGLIDNIIKLFINIMEIIPTVFSPGKVIDDVMYASTSGVAQVFKAFLEKIDFGQSEPDNKGDGGPFGVNDKQRAICVPPSFVNLLILVLCPPLALFMFKGIGGWFGVIICSLLTYYLYYFPGFIYAALHILC